MLRKFVGGLVDVNEPAGRKVYRRFKRDHARGRWFGNGR